MIHQDSSTNQYQVIGIDHTGYKQVWEEGLDYQAALKQEEALTEEVQGINFHTIKSAAPTDEEIMAEFSHLDFGVSA